SDGSSWTLWIPLVWMLLAGSRYVSQWLALGTPIETEEAYLDGSPIDRNVFLFLIIAAIYILLRRRIDWNRFFSQNKWIWLFFLFGLLSIGWSDYSFVSFKRWIKFLGNIVMALVILTEARPYEALGTVLRRLAYVLLPLSVLFIKFYPNIGRAYHMGVPTFTGVAFQKNGLGQICLIAGIYFAWDLLLNRHESPEFSHRLHYTIYLLILPMLLWLFHMASSATSLVCMFIVFCIFLIGRQPIIRRKPSRILYIGAAILVSSIVLEYLFNISDAILAFLGRDPSLTSRVPIWNEILGMVTNPLLGTGFESFWSGDRMSYIWDRFENIIQSHNGYIDIYINIGFVGLGLLIGCIVSGFIKAFRVLYRDYLSAMLRIGLIVAVVAYNFTEAAFKPLNNMFVLLLIGLIDTPLVIDGTAPAFLREGPLRKQ
ncbi:MAG TPA: O-antigen ligase family protein, partial [Thermodesulfobacteriota bacterium]|nr:O-antigen ligase family protein [Thermodesulfobacteriota bacterium]